MSGTRSFMWSTMSLRGHRMALDDTQTASSWWAGRSPKTNLTFKSLTHSSSGRWIPPSDCVGSLPLPSCSSQSACWRSWAACCSSRPHFSTRMLRCSCSTTHCCHRADLDSAASTMSARRPRRTYGSCSSAYRYLCHGVLYSPCLSPLSEAETNVLTVISYRCSPATDNGNLQETHQEMR